MPLNGPRAEKQPRTDLPIRKPIARQARDLALLRRQVVAALDRPLAYLAARSQQLVTCALGKRLHPDRHEHFVGGAELLARIDPAILAAQPLPVEQMSPGELGAQPGAAQPLDRLAMQALGTLTLAHECPAARLDSQAPVGVAGRGGRYHALERTGRDLVP